MSDAGPLLVVAAALVGTAGRVLLQQRPPGKSLAGLWEFPGGKVEPGETPEQALVRELFEELGVTVEARHLEPVAFTTAIVGERHLLLLLYHVAAWSGEPKALEATGLIWAAPAAMRTLAMPPADVPLVRALERMIADRG